jgi:oligogalacturonide lyase
MELAGRHRAARSRRWFLIGLPAVCLAEVREKGRVFPSAIFRYPDPATEFTVLRLTDPAHTSRLPAYHGRAVSRHTNFLLYASDLTGRFQAFRMELKSGQSRQLTAADDLDPASLTLLPGERGFCYLDGGGLMTVPFSHLRSREVYRIPEGFERGPGFGLAEDGQYGAVIERIVDLKGLRHRLRLVHMATGSALTLAEGDEEFRDPIPRPGGASVLYRRGSAAWLADYDGRMNYQLRLCEGETGPALWSPDGDSVFYLTYPEDRHKLHNIRQFTLNGGQDQMIAETTQFVQFACNADASVFAGASGGKASPYVLLLVRTVKRELTLAEHRASDPRMVAPIFAPDSQSIFFTSDRHGKPAIYAMDIRKLVEDTDRG